MTAKAVDDFISASDAGVTPPFPTVMERLITDNPEKGYTRISRESLRHEMITMISAGNDTTGTTATVGLFQIINNQAIQARLLAELKTVLPKPTDSAPLTLIEKLPYLTAVIKESLRYASALPTWIPRLVPTGGATLPDGRYLPAGTRVGISTYHIHYNPDIFPSPHTFMPERWLEEENRGEKGNLEEMNRFLVPFSRGARMCLGMNLAYMELYVMIAYLVRRFDLETDTTEEDMRWDDMVIPMFYGVFTIMAKRRVE